MSTDSVATKALHAAIAELVAIHADILAVSRRSDDGWRRALIALRRRLQQQIATMSQLLDTVDASDEDMRRLRAALGRMRSGVALHQANWPAVIIDRADPDYQASVREVRAANREFTELVAGFLSHQAQAALPFQDKEFS